MNEPKKKRQHYVPRLLLRKFSKDDRTISLLVLSTGKQISGASLKAQCYEDYFYGADGALENAFAQLEGKFSNILGDMAHEHLESLTQEQIQDARLFLHYQRARTLGAAEEMNEFDETLIKQLISKDSRFSDMDLNKFKITRENAQHDALYHASTTVPLLEDLKVKFLISDKKIGFVTSDHPVITYNQFAEHHPKFRHYRGTTGLATKGLQLFLPLSPRVCLVVYDPSAYTLGNEAKRTCGIGLRDIRLLNALQMLHAHECVYFVPEFTPKEELERLEQERARYGGWRKTKVFEGEMEERPDDMLSQLVVFSKPEVRIGAQFGFMQVIDRSAYASYNLPDVPVRSQKMVDLTRQYGEFLDKMVEERAQAKKKHDKPGGDSE